MQDFGGERLAVISLLNILCFTSPVTEQGRLFRVTLKSLPCSVTGLVKHKIFNKLINANLSHPKSCILSYIYISKLNVIFFQ